MNTRYLHRMLMALIIATLLALVWHHTAMDSILKINGLSPYAIKTVDDRVLGGQSIATFKRQDEKIVLECAINQGHPSPYCKLVIELKKPPAGLNLTKYKTVRLWMRYESPEPQQQIRFFIRPFNPAYSEVKDPRSLKTQEIAYDPSRYRLPLEIDLSRFTVASWWINSHNIPIEYAGTEFDNVSTLEISTGGKVLPGIHRITIERIEFAGKIISTEGIRLLIIGLWLISVLGYLTLDGIMTRRKLLASHNKQAALKRINENLRAQTKTFAKLARHDPLTGILNRKGLSDEIRRLAEYPNDPLFPLSFIFLDIDHFKKINDQYGHDMGDKVIKEFANTIKSEIGRHDLLARWGGEEFLIICTHTQLHEATLVAERLRKIISGRAWPAGIQVTSSFGVSESIAGENINKGIKRADAAMYRAKKNGRNRVEIELITIVT